MYKRDLKINDFVQLVVGVYLREIKCSFHELFTIKYIIKLNNLAYHRNIIHFKTYEIKRIELIFPFESIPAFLFVFVYVYITIQPFIQRI